MNKNFKTEGGYTIIETMIAVALFVVIVMIGMGSLLNANLLHQKSADMRSIMDNLSFIMEDIGRNLRTGSSFHCIRSDTGGLAGTPGNPLTAPLSGSDCFGIAFESQNGNGSDPNDQWVYYLDNGNIWKSTQGNSNYTQLNPSEVSVTGLNLSGVQVSGFSVLGAEGAATDKGQPFVTIRLVGSISYHNVLTPFSLQTSVSQRLIDI